MRRALFGAFIGVLLLTGITARTSHAAQSLTKVVMTTGSFSEREAAMYVAQDQGIFRRYGLDLSQRTRRHGRSRRR
jgi:ABC-type nitrate/sulfonate/bicarbonate transport system substrate-binding protein